MLLVITDEYLRTESGRARLLRCIGGRGLKSCPSIIQPNYINSLIQSVGLMTRLFEGGLFNNSWSPVMSVASGSVSSRVRRWLSPGSGASSTTWGSRQIALAVISINTVSTSASLMSWTFWIFGRVHTALYSARSADDSRNAIPPDNIPFTISAVGEVASRVSNPEIKTLVSMITSRITSRVRLGFPESRDRVLQTR